jgi:hypothetical protein
MSFVPGTKGFLAIAGIMKRFAARPINYRRRKLYCQAAVSSLLVQGIGKASVVLPVESDDIKIQFTVYKLTLPGEAG